MRYKISDPFYHTGAWKRARAACLMRDHHLCVDCLEAYQARQGGRPRPATMVHHIIPVEERPDLGYDLNNLVALCDTCHNRRHPEKGAGTEKPGPPAGMRIIKL